LRRQFRGGQRRARVRRSSPQLCGWGGGPIVAAAL